MFKPRINFITLVMLFEAALLPLSLALSWLCDLPLALSPDGLWIAVGVLSTLPIWWLLVWARGLRVRPVEEFFAWVDSNIVTLFRGAAPWQIAVIAVLAGFGEEMLFRGILQQALQGWLGAWPGLLLASIAFGVAHWVNRTYMIFACIMGLYLGVLYWRTGSLLVPVIVHALYDFLALRMLVRELPNRSSEPV